MTPRLWVYRCASVHVHLCRRQGRRTPNANRGAFLGCGIWSLFVPLCKERACYFNNQPWSSVGVVSFTFLKVAQTTEANWRDRRRWSQAWPQIPFHEQPLLKDTLLLTSFFSLFKTVNTKDLPCFSLANSVDCGNTGLAKKIIPALSIPLYGKTQRNFLADPILALEGRASFTRQLQLRPACR